MGRVLALSSRFAPYRPTGKDTRLSVRLMRSESEDGKVRLVCVYSGR
jgi:hypothetical protein